ncbi:class I SAM-dependent methyltransferase [Senegalia massiliensis]|uniref:Class I SAM-dependent methyltransferase n=1 Tax=Senegalia massiliensis TaxID=1720316 RepID=A0A845QTQ0_9CLOT|nr:class I SAM-dependent methyltransferase [Senegalia massiliensis]NBI05414.1 class I SAM-dependent methyltransferase [Senegalia massiliensis]
MDIKSKSWNWDEVKEKFWGEPAEEVYYLGNRWKKENNMKVLDLGCGIGRHSIFLSQNDFDVYAHDLSESGLRKLDEVSSKEGLNIKINLGDMVSLPYESNFFNCILAYNAIYHTDRVGIEKVISEIKRTLKDNGEIYLTFNSKNNPSFNNPSNEKIGENTIIKTEGKEKGIPHYYVDEKEVRRLMKDFKIISLRHVEEIGDDWRSWHYYVLAKFI